MRVQPAESNSKDLTQATAGSPQGGDHAQQRGLARPVGTGNADAFAGLHHQEADRQSGCARRKPPGSPAGPPPSYPSRHPGRVWRRSAGGRHPLLSACGALHEDRRHDGAGGGEREAVRSLIEAGIDVARLNFSHGDHDLHRKFAGGVRAGRRQRDETSRCCRTAGPKLKLGRFRRKRTAKAGSIVRCYPGRALSEAPDQIYIDYPHLLEDVEVGEDLLLADGLIRLVATGERDDHLEARVVVGGPLGNGKACSRRPTCECRRSPKRTRWTSSSEESSESTGWQPPSYALPPTSAA